MSEIRRISVESSIRAEDVAREVFNQLNSEDKYFVTKTATGRGFLFDVKGKEKSFLNISNFHYEFNLYKEADTVIIEFTNKDLEAKVIKYAKSFLIGGGLYALHTKEKQDKIQAFPDEIEHMIKNFIAKR